MLAIIQAGPTLVDLRLWPLIVVVAGAAALTLALQGLTSFLGDYASRDRRAAELDEALALWPPLAVGQANAFDLGVRPEARMGDGSIGPYRARPEDREIDDALENADVVLLIGPAGSGKSRAAVEALCRVRNDAQLIVPEDAVGLTRVLQGVSDLLGASHSASHGHVEQETRYVLWLDDLERFVDALHLDALDDFQRSSSDPRPGARARVADFVSGSRSRCKVQIVATVREDRLRRLLSDAGETANVARRFVARARRVHVPRRRPRFADMSCRPSDALFEPKLSACSPQRCVSARRYREPSTSAACSRSSLPRCSAPS